MVELLSRISRSPVTSLTFLGLTRCRFCSRFLLGLGLRRGSSPFWAPLWLKPSLGLSPVAQAPPGFLSPLSVGDLVSPELAGPR